MKESANRWSNRTTNSTALDAEAKAKKLGVKFQLPVDVVVATPVDTGKLNKKGKPVFDFTNVRTVSGRYSRRRGRIWHRRGNGRALRRNHQGRENDFVERPDGHV